MRVGLVLSGGGARCFAQIGVLRALEEGGVTVSAIAGASTGGILGALYAAGHRADALQEIVAGVEYSTFLKPGKRSGLIGHGGVRALLEKHLPATFEALHIPLALTVTDIQNAELLVFREGPLIVAATASNAFPGLFTPVEHEGRYLMDGGILDNFPVDVGRMMTHDPILAVDTVPSPRRHLDLGGADSSTLVERLTRPLRGELPSIPLMIEVLEKAYTITQSRLIELRNAMFPPQAMLRPELPSDFGVQDFGRLEEAVAHGYEAARRYLDTLP